MSERTKVFKYFQDNHTLSFFDAELDEIILHLIEPHKKRVEELEKEKAELIAFCYKITEAYAFADTAHEFGERAESVVDEINAFMDRQGE